MPQKPYEKCLESQRKQSANNKYWLLGGVGALQTIHFLLLYLRAKSWQKMYCDKVCGVLAAGVSGVNENALHAQVSILLQTKKHAL